MEFDCTKEGKNIYFACREKAAKYNDLLNSRERAAELLGISTSTLANHELGVTKNVPPDALTMDKFIEAECILSEVHQGYNAGISRAIEIVKGGIAK